MPGASSTVTADDDGQQYLYDIGAYNSRPLQNVSATPQQVQMAAAPALPSSSLDFLADISTHQAQNKHDAHSMMVDDQQGYLGWDEVGPTDQPSHREAVYETIPNDDLVQLWLEEAVGRLRIRGLILGFGMLYR